MLNHLDRKTFPAGSQIFTEGDWGDCAYIVDSGCVEIYSSESGEQRISKLGQGDLFGEVALIDHLPRSASARAIEDSVLVPIQRKLIEELLSTTHPVVRHLLLLILDRYRNTRYPVQSQVSFAGTGSGTPEKSKLSNLATRKLTLAHDISGAIANNEFELYYQPICQLSTGHIVGFEALIRWYHPKEGMVAPQDFLQLAEQTGQIHEVGYWVLGQACKDWPVLRNSTHYKLPFVSVNLSPAQLTSDSLVSDIAAILQRHNMPPGELKLELSEKVIIDKPKLALELLGKLSELGSTLALDDFGTGHSGLGSLQLYPIGTLKIDRVFINSMLQAPHSLEIVRSTINLAHSIGMDVVAEGIETDEIRNSLLELECNFGQGWLFGRPMRLEDIAV